MSEGGEFQDVGQMPSLMSLVWRLLSSVDLELPIVIWFVIIVMLFLVMLHFRRKPFIAGLVFIPICTGIWYTPWVNSIMMKNELASKLGFKKNYFDHAGVFVFVFWFIPQVLIASLFLIILVCLVIFKAWTLWQSYRKLMKNDQRTASDSK